MVRNTKVIINLSWDNCIIREYKLDLPNGPFITEINP